MSLDPNSNSSLNPHLKSAGQLPPEVEFLIESDKLKSILRHCLIHEGSRRENSAEHSWQLALAVLSTHTLANEPLDLLRALKMALIHDVVEIDAGDTFIYDTQANKGKFERELAAAERIFGLLPGATSSELKSLWIAFEEQKCAESRFVNALDRFLPVLANCRTQGHAWKINGVKRSQVVARNASIEKGSKQLWQVARTMIESAHAQGHLLD